MTIFATENSMNTIKDNSNFAYKSDVISSHWTTHLKHSHQAEIEIQVQCEAMAVIEYWHYSVFDPNEKLCYFGIISMNNFKKSGDEETTPPDGSSTSEAPPLAEGELLPLIVDDSASRQVQINTAELGFFLDDFFTERSSVIYQPFTYNGFSNPLNKEHCSIQCAFDPDYKCDFWFIHHSHCYLGSFNQESGIGVLYSSETITAYIFKGTMLPLINESSLTIKTLIDLQILLMICWTDYISLLLMSKIIDGLQEYEKNSPLSQIMNVEGMLLLQIMILIIGLGLMEIVTLVI